MMNKNTYHMWKLLFFINFFVVLVVCSDSDETVTPAIKEKNGELKESDVEKSVIKTHGEAEQGSENINLADNEEKLTADEKASETSTEKEISEEKEKGSESESSIDLAKSIPAEKPKEGKPSRKGIIEENHEKPKTHSESAGAIHKGRKLLEKIKTTGKNITEEIQGNTKTNEKNADSIHNEAKLAAEEEEGTEKTSGEHSIKDEEEEETSKSSGSTNHEEKIAATEKAEMGKEIQQTTETEYEVTDQVPEGNEEVASTEQSSIAEIPKKYSTRMFKLRDAKGNTCLLADISNAVFTVTYPAKGAEKSIEVKLPYNATINGKCEDEEKSPFIRFSWDEFVFKILFSKLTESDESDRWAVTKMEFNYEITSPRFEGASQRGKRKTHTKDLEMFSTLFGYSNECPLPEEIKFYNGNKVAATLKMQEIQLQPFDVKGSEFSEAIPCSQDVEAFEEPYVQDETVPLAVGLTLAILTLIGVLGFSFYRAYTVPKVDYNTME